MIMVTLGGMSTASGVEAATTPVASPRSYPSLSISGTEIRPKATAAGIPEPEQAANRALARTTAEARPPWILASHTRAV